MAIKNINEEVTQRLAVLIDADNAQPSVIEGVLAEIARFGEVAVKRIYGDFTSQSSISWKKVLNTYAIKPVQQYAYTTGKNATDSTMIIDAMDLLYTGRFDGFCIMSSDSDFTGLAVRIREEGLRVYGFGEQKTPESFRNACHKFTFTELFRPIVEPNVNAINEGVSCVEAGEPKSETQKLNPNSKKFTNKFFRQAVEQAYDESGWANLGTFGSYLLKLHPDFDPRTFGFKKLSDFVKSKLDIFDIEERVVNNTAHKNLYIRAKVKK